MVEKIPVRILGQPVFQEVPIRFELLSQLKKSLEEKISIGELQGFSLYVAGRAVNWINGGEMFDSGFQILPMTCRGNGEEVSIPFGCYLVSIAELSLSAFRLLEWAETKKAHKKAPGVKNLIFSGYVYDFSGIELFQKAQALAARRLESISADEFLSTDLPADFELGLHLAFASLPSHKWGLFNAAWHGVSCCFGRFSPMVEGFLAYWSCIVSRKASMKKTSYWQVEALQQLLQLAVESEEKPSAKGVKDFLRKSNLGGKPLELDGAFCKFSGGSVSLATTTGSHGNVIESADYIKVSAETFTKAVKKFKRLDSLGE